MSCDDPASLASLAVLDAIGRSGGVPRGARVGLGRQGQTLAARWLAAGIPLTLLLDIADPSPRNSLRIARHEAATQPLGRLREARRDAASVLDVSP